MSPYHHPDKFALFCLLFLVLLFVSAILVAAISSLASRSRKRLALRFDIGRLLVIVAVFGALFWFVALGGGGLYGFIAALITALAISIVVVAARHTDVGRIFFVAIVSGGLAHLGYLLASFGPSFGPRPGIFESLLVAIVGAFVGGLLAMVITPFITRRPGDPPSDQAEQADDQQDSG